MVAGCLSAVRLPIHWLAGPRSGSSAQSPQSRPCCSQFSLFPSQDSEFALYRCWTLTTSRPGSSPSCQWLACFCQCRCAHPPTPTPTPIPMPMPAPFSMPFTTPWPQVSLPMPMPGPMLILPALQLSLQLSVSLAAGLWGERRKGSFCAWGAGISGLWQLLVPYLSVCPSAPVFSLWPLAFASGPSRLSVLQSLTHFVFRASPFSRPSILPRLSHPIPLPLSLLRPESLSIAFNCPIS